MVIGIDIRFLSEGKRTGVEEYALNLLHHLFCQYPENTFKLFANFRHGSAEVLNELGAYPNVTIFRFRHSNKLLNLAFKFGRRPAIDKMIGGCAVFFYPNIIFGATTPGCPTVTTFHDLSFEYHPEFLSLKKRFWHWLVNPRYCAQRSTLIVAVSSSTKADLVDKYGVPPGIVRVIPSGINLPAANLGEQTLAVKRKYRLPDKFILFFGTREPRKNVIGVIQAFEKCRKSGKINTPLVIAGSSGWLEKGWRQAVARSPVSRAIQCLGFVEQSDKLALFSLADLLVFPSFYEGFGFPPLEAMSVGTPVITSSISSLPEVVGDAALLVNPYNVEEIATAIEQLETDADLRATFIKRGWQRVQTFSWDKAARETFQVLAEAAQRRG